MIRTGKMRTRRLNEAGTPTILYNSATTALVYLQLSIEPPLTLSHAAKQSFGSQKVTNRTGMPRSNSVKALEKLMAT